MNKYILILLSLTHAWCLSAKENWTAIPDWLVLPQGKEKLGNMHGDIAVRDRIRSPDMVDEWRHGAQAQKRISRRRVRSEPYRHSYENRN